VISDSNPNDAVLDISGTAEFNVAGLTNSSTPTPMSDPSPPPVPLPPSNNGAGGSGIGHAPEIMHLPHNHEMFVFNSFARTGAEIANFNTALDKLDVAPLLHLIGYKGHDPFADHTLTIAHDAQHHTEVMLHDPGHDTLVVTLDHVQPHGGLPHADILWH